MYCPTPKEVKKNLSQNTKVLKKARFLKNFFGEDAFDTIYYAHDITSDFIAQSAMQAFPSAKRVCFGDGLGIFYSLPYFTQTNFPLNPFSHGMRNPKKIFFNALRRSQRYWTLPRTNERKEAEYLVAVRPSDLGTIAFMGKL